MPLFLSPFCAFHSCVLCLLLQFLSSFPFSALIS